MKLRRVVVITMVTFFFLSCRDSSLINFDSTKINALLSQLDEENPVFVRKDVAFDSIITVIGTRKIDGSVDKIKAKLFYYDSFCRGYFNLMELDDKNLQVFGQKVEDYWAFKCVTKLNMEEAGGYIVMNEDRKGIWSNGHQNFQKGQISWHKSAKDYSQITN